jgi:hypothetical protein
MTYIKIIKVCPSGPVDAAAIIVICIAIINQSINAAEATIGIHF